MNRRHLHGLIEKELAEARRNPSAFVPVILVALARVDPLVALREG
jgi:hypothetical protein